ncbi:hypothetical protein AB0C59_09640 [Streptomyces sp. NPDC048664]|uniref:BACON domain-containing protein n=1 Tax=Streptomyces sp. NPDC048664 TaxID=3154505 RepID=UPI00343A3CB5
MMSSRPDISPHASGAHQARRDTHQRGGPPHGAHPHPLSQRPAARYDAYLDGLFTYCLSVLCDHEEATTALGDALALAERRGSRRPDTADDRRAWLYALARWSCLRRLAEARRRRQAGHAAGRSGHGGGRDGRAAGPGAASRAHKDAADRRAATAIAGSRTAEPHPAPVSEETGQRRHRELARLAWPEAAGTSPEQREALELAVRHQLAVSEVAAVLGMGTDAARELLASAACEVERTRAALAVVETGSCPSIARLTGDERLVLSATLRRELVRHVDDCPRCRRTAERAVPGAWPGTSVTPAALPVLDAPRAALHTAMTHASRARGVAPRFDRRGFPMDPKDHAARRDRLRARAVTTTVVATVIAAPVIALWAAHRGPAAGEGTDAQATTARETHDAGTLGGGEQGGGYENTGNTRAKPDHSFGKDGHEPDVSVEVIGVRTGAPEAGRLTVAAANDGTTTLVTLRASGTAPVRWSASTGAGWLYLSKTSGTLAPGESLTIRVYVDHLREPSGPWHARVRVAPAGMVVSIDGYGTAGESRPSPTPVHTAPSSPAPSRPPTTSAPPTSPDPTGSPTPSGTPSSSPPPSSSPSTTPAPSTGATGSNAFVYQ